MIKRCFGLVDELSGGSGISATNRRVFACEQRQRMIEAETGGVAKQKGVDLEVIAFDELLVDVARQNGVNIILRGLRTAADYEYEAQMTSMNRSMAPEIETVFLPATPDVSFVSSTLVRQILAMGGDISPFVPRSVLEEIK